jgi:hypothetical protein
VTGIAATALGLWSIRRPLPVRAVRIFNIVGRAARERVVIAILSMPVPFRIFQNARQCGSELPSFNTDVLVQTALLSHLLILRRLAAETAPCTALTQGIVPLGRLVNLALTCAHGLKALRPFVAQILDFTWIRAKPPITSLASNGRQSR